MEEKKHEYSKHKFGWPSEDTPDVTLFTFFDLGYDLSEAMDMYSEWDDAHGGPQFEICTNNHYEAELEEEWIRDRQKAYGLTDEQMEEQTRELDRQLREDFKRHGWEYPEDPKPKKRKRKN